VSKDDTFFKYDKNDRVTQPFLFAIRVLRISANPIKHFALALFGQSTRGGPVLCPD